MLSSSLNRLIERQCLIVGSHPAGSMFDKDGNLANWWDQTSLAEFQIREKCLVDQYQQYTVLGHHVSHVMRTAVLSKCMWYKRYNSKR